MISNPKHGWCVFELGDFKGGPSYLTDVPVDLLDAFIDYHEKGAGIAWFDEEGNEFTFVINPYAIYIIEEKEKPILHDFSIIKVKELEEELIKDIEKDLDLWALEFVVSDEQNEIQKHKQEICEKIKTLKGYMNGRRPKDGKQ